MSAGHSTPGQRAAADVRRHVRQVAVDVHGATAGEEPIAGMSVATRPVLDDPLAGVRAADLIRRVAQAQVHDWAEAARAAGRSWDDIADALALPADTAESRGEVAFGWLVDGQPPAAGPPSFGRSAARWTCTSCGQRVTDSGPFESHPDDREDGHAADCARHSAAVAAYRREWDR